MLALQEWRHWLEDAVHPFIVWTDHKNLAYLRSAHRLNPRQARWALFLGRFNFILTYHPGSRNAIIPSSCVVGAARWEVEQEVQEALQGHTIPEHCPRGRLFVPPSVRSSVLQWCHSSKLACHPGYYRTLAPEILVAVHVNRHPRVCLRLLHLCSQQIFSPCSSWPPPSLTHTSSPLVARCCGLCYRLTTIRWKYSYTYYC